MTTISDPSAMTPDDPRWLSWFMQQRRFDRLSRKAQTGASLITDFAAGVYEMGYPGQRRGSYELSDLITFTRASGGGRFNSSGVYEWVGNDVPRFDYDPVTLQPLGLLIEEARTNLLTYSAAFDNPVWGGSGRTIAANASLSPDGSLSADGIVESAAAQLHFIERIYSATAGTQLTYSLFIKAGARSFARMYLGGTNRFTGQSSYFAAGAVFNLTNGTVSNATTAASMVSVGGGWWKCSVTSPIVSNNGAVEVHIRVGQSENNFTYAGDGTSGIYIWGAQLEAGAFPTSYIPTVASQVTRAADIASVNTLSPWYNAAEGTFEVSARGIVGQPLLTAGSAVITADSAALKDYALSYTTDPSASSLVIGKGHTRSIKYFPRSDA